MSFSSTRSATAEGRPAYLERLNAWLDEHADVLDEEARQKRATSPLRVFDVKTERVREALKDAPKIGDSLCAACAEHFAQVRAYLDAYGVAYTIVPTLVRGLDYYSRTTWEFVGPDDSTQGSTISAGGRYDYLIEEIGGPPTPGVGFGAGIERLVLSLELEGVTAEPPTLDVFLAVDGGSRADAFTLLAQLRARGIAADADYAGRSLKGQFTQAQRSGARDTVIFREGSITLRRRGDQDVDVQADEPAREAGVMSSWRDTTCGVLGAADAGTRVKLAGWADTRRDHGSLVFIDLRDFSGKVQLVINPERTADAAAVAHEVRNEFVLQAEGEVVVRAPEAVNPNLPTGEIEVQVDTLTIVSRSEPLPFQIGEDVDEALPPQVPLARHARRADAAQPPAPSHRDRRDPTHDGRAELRRRVDAEHDEGNAGGRTRLSSCRCGCSPGSSSRSRSRRSSSSSCAWSAGSTATTRSPRAGGTRTCAPTGSSSSSSSTSRCRSSTGTT